MGSRESIIFGDPFHIMQRGAFTHSLPQEINMSTIKNRQSGRDGMERLVSQFPYLRFPHSSREQEVILVCVDRQPDRLNSSVSLTSFIFNLLFDHLIKNHKQLSLFTRKIFFFHDLLFPTFNFYYGHS